MPTDLSTVQKAFLVLLRTVIGWHFLYEGIVKVMDPKWSSASYLSESKWIFSGLFHWMVSHPAVLKVVDLANIWGLIFIGLGLFFGFLTQIACFSGILLLLLYYIAIPPLVGLGAGLFTEGNYLVVDKNLVEMLALCVLMLFPTGHIAGLDRMVFFIRAHRTRNAKEKKTKSKPVDASISDPSVSMRRREILSSLATMPIFGAFAFAVLKKKAWDSWEERHLAAAVREETQTMTGATIKTFQFASLKDLKGKLPYGKIGNLKITRLFLGGNLIGGWAHARDLIYVSKLIKAYHNDRKVFDTFRLAERCGINTILTNPQLARVINEYWRKEAGTIQFISDCGYKGDAITGAKVSIDAGAHACYIQGEISDRLVRENKLDTLQQALDFIRQNKLPAGIGAHRLETVQACVRRRIEPDFWVKTLHRTNYWSAAPKIEKDNIWCTNPEETIAFMGRLKQPWIAFKVLAAGAIEPKEGFKFAFENGADFICVGMYDFQIVEDVNFTSDILSKIDTRNRPWFA